MLEWFLAIWPLMAIHFQSLGIVTMLSPTRSCWKHCHSRNKPCQWKVLYRCPGKFSSPRILSPYGKLTRARWEGFKKRALSQEVCTQFVRHIGYIISSARHRIPYQQFNGLGTFCGSGFWPWHESLSVNKVEVNSRVSRKKGKITKQCFKEIREIRCTRLKLLLSHWDDLFSSWNCFSNFSQTTALPLVIF